MFINGVLLLVLLGVGYIWSTRGFFSAVLHMMCVLVAGAIAFALWEPVAMAMLGTGSEFMKDIAWGAGLLIPFAVSAGVLSALTNLVLRNNMKCDDIANIIGGIACGGVVGVVTAGMLAISVSMVRSSAEFMGFTGMDFDKGGSPIRNRPLWLPLDSIVAGFYMQTSENVLATSTPLARYYPDLTVRGHLMKAGPEGQILKFAAAPGDVSLIGRYTVGEVNPLDINALTKDTFDKDRNQKVLDLDGNPIAGQCQIEGFVIKPGGGLNEKMGQKVFGNAFVTLVAVEPTSGYSQSFQPFAMISQARPDRPWAGRWRFDGPRVFLSSVGGGGETPMGFEFLVPKGFVPIALYVRGLRINLVEPGDEEYKPLTPTFSKYARIEARDEAVRTGALLVGSSVAPGIALDTSKATPWRAPAAGGIADLNVSNSLPLSMVLQKGTGTTGLELDDKNWIISGIGKYFNKEIQGRGLEKSLRVEKFLVDGTTVIVQLDVSAGKAFDMLAATAANAEGPPVLVDNLSTPQRHQCVGWVYRDQNTTEIRYDPGSPVTDKGQLPSLSKSRTDQQLILLFRCSLNVKLQYYAIGNTAVKEFGPVINLDQAQNTGR